MFPDSGFAHPQPSFITPVPLTGVDIDADPVVYLKINRTWIPYLAGAIKQLVLQSTWATTDPDALWLQQQRVMMIFANFAQALDHPLQVCEDAVGPGISLEDSLSSQIRISPDDACIIQMWCIDHWENWYDPRTCIATGSGQQTAGGAGQPGPGTSRTYCQTILGNTPYLYPVNVNTGDQIEISDVGGTWSDANVGLLSQWYCPDGTPYTLGVCAGPTHLNAGDPLPTSPHMGLIAFISPNYYFIGSGASFIVPAGVSDAQMLLTCNTADYSNALGSVSACIKITTPQPLPIDLTYSFGSGPSSVASGGVFTLTSSNNAGNQRFDVQSPSECIQWEVLSSSGWISSGSSESPFYADCASAPHNHTGADVAPEVFLNNVNGVQIIANGSGGTPFTCQVRVTRLP